MRTTKPSSWAPPSKGSLKLNTDAVVKKELGIVGLGRVIRDDKGEVLGAFSRRILGNFEIAMAECLVIHVGLVFALERGLHPQEIESDTLNVIRAL